MTERDLTAEEIASMLASTRSPEWRKALTMAARTVEAGQAQHFEARAYEYIAELERQLAKARELCDDLLGYARVEWAWKYGATWAAEYRSAFGVDEPRHALDAPQPKPEDCR